MKRTETSSCNTVRPKMAVSSQKLAASRGTVDGSEHRLVLTAGVDEQRDASIQAIITVIRERGIDLWKDNHEPRRIRIKPRSA